MNGPHSYINFPGTCQEAIDLYAKVLGAKVERLIRVKDTPMAAQAPADQHDRVMHVRLAIGDSHVLASDVPSEHYKPAQGISLCINLDDAAEADRVYAALADGGTQTMPIAQTFWALRFGMLVDRFGIPWMINCEAKQG